ncbi:MAG: Outer rane receptor protein, mostly Fe transport [Firmicutes bacterium]|nr:Outer rane receptor protein, mostly Fe transport [Bacillota bacterium]
MEQRQKTLMYRCCMLLMMGFLLLSSLSAAPKFVSSVTNFPKETLIKRIQKIEQLKKLKSLKATELSYVKYSESSYAIVRKKAEDDNKKKTKSTGTGNLSGFILGQKGEPLVGATVRIPNTQLGTVTNIEGKYSLKAVPVGTVTVEASYLSFETRKITEVKINSARTTLLNLVMKEASKELGEVVVTAGYKQASAEGLYAKQKTMISMTDGISADMIKKTPDNNAAQILRRVSGVTLDNDKFVVIRGMSDRYNNVEMNGSSLPSTEPNKRNFSFDIIPSVLIDNVTIAKTFTPDMQGDFVGGTVQVRTLAVPEKKFLTFSLGTGANTNSTGKDFWSSKRFNSDYFLGNEKERFWFGRDWKQTEYNSYWESQNPPIPTGGDWSKVNAMNAAIPNHFGLRRYTGAPTQSYSLVGGLPIRLAHDHTLGVVGAVTYRHEETTSTTSEGHSMDGDSIMSKSQSKFITTLGALANFSWQHEGHKITWRNLYNNRFTHSDANTIHNNSNGFFLMDQYSRIFINKLFQTQLDGAHDLLGNKLHFTWLADYSHSQREQPDDRLIRGSLGESGYGGIAIPMQKPVDGKYAVDWGYGIGQNGYNISEGHIMYSDLDESKKNIGGDLEFPFTIAGNPQKLKGGYRGTFRTSDYSQQYLRQMNGTGNSTSTISDVSTAEGLYSSQNFANGWLYYNSAGVAANSIDHYNGTQTIHAGYLMGEFTFIQKLHLMGGFRLEKAKTVVKTAATEQVDKNDNWLPSLTAIYNITNKINFRAAYSKTVIRPEFRELSPCIYYSVEERMEVLSSKLVQTSSENIDLRLEWYPQAGEVISFSAFHKEYRKPVESVTQYWAGNLSSYLVNLDSSTAQGLEFNMRKSFGFITPILQNVYLTTNAMVMKSNVKYDLANIVNVTSTFDKDRERPLQGLAPWVMNAGLDYQGKIVGASINYNKKGRTLVHAGYFKKYDEFENPRDVLDLQLSVRLMQQRLELKLNAGDLLNQAFIVYNNSGYKTSGDEPDKLFEDRTALGMNYNSGDWTLSKTKRGITFSFAASYKF